MHLKNVIIESLKKVSGLTEVVLDVPEREEFGDYSTSIALKGKTLNLNLKKDLNPRDIAEEIVKKLKTDVKLLEIIEKIEIAGPGFINFYLKNSVYISNLKEIIKEGDNYGRSDHLKGKKIMIEFAHPNTHKQFHIGHLRNITTGESICRILSFAGAQVIRANYQGDVGLHIAKALYGLLEMGYSDPGEVKSRVELLGKAYSQGNSAYEGNEEAKKKIHELNKKIYDKSDDDINKLYKETRQWSLDYFENIYKRVGTTFDRYYFESEVYEKGLEIALKALEKGILEKSEGAVIFPGSKYSLHDRVFITSESVPTYEGKDLGLANLQFSEFNPDAVVHVVGPEQAEYFKVVFKALEFIQPETEGREVHVPYGWVKLKEGKMSSRTGNVVLGEWLLDEARNKIVEKFKSDEETADIIAVGAVKYSFLRNSLEQEIAFDINESISLEGNSGPYLQYTYARIQSVLKNADSGGTGIDNFDLNESTYDTAEIKFNKEELSVLRSLMYFPEILKSVAIDYSPNLLCNYLYDLAQKFNTFYNMHRILSNNSNQAYNDFPVEQKSDSAVLQNYRLILAFTTGMIIKSGLNLLGIESLREM